MSVDPIPPYVPNLPVLQVTWPVVRKLFVEVTEALTGYGRGRVLVETLSDRRPADGSPYASLWFFNLEPLAVNVGDLYYDDPAPTANTDGIQVHDNESLASVRFSFWGANAYTEALQFMQMLHSARRFQDLWNIVGFAGFDAVQDVSMEYGGQIQQRAIFNMDFYVCLGRALPADWFNVSQWEVDLPTVKDETGDDYKETWELSKEIKDGPPCDLS